MLRLVSFLAALLLPIASVAAQSKSKPEHPFSISLQGGPMLSVNENSFTYVDNGHASDLITKQAGLAFSYYFNGRFGARLSGSYGRNAGGCNVDQTKDAENYYPYKFDGVNVFLDGLVNLSNEWKEFSSVFYIGIGVGHTFNFTESGHPWQKVSHKNTAYGARVGLLFQYDFSSHFGAYLDFCGEAYEDNYNGLEPYKGDHDQVYGSAGFPYDLRGLASFGLIFHF